MGESDPVVKTLQAELELLVTRQDAQEQMLANLTLAYSEIATALEVVMTRMMEPINDEDRAAFRASLAEAHTKMLEELANASRNISSSAPSPDTAISRLVQQWHQRQGSDQGQDSGADSSGGVDPAAGE